MTKGNNSKGEERGKEKKEMRKRERERERERVGKQDIFRTAQGRIKGE